MMRDPFPATLMMVALAAAPGSTVAADDDRPVDTARDALERSGRYPWYDAQTDGVRRVHLDPSGPSRSDNPDAQAGTHSGRRGSSSRGDDDDLAARDGIRLHFGSPLLGAAFRGLAWGLLVAVFIALVVVLIRAFLDREARQAETADRAESLDDGEGENRAGDLPWAAWRPRSDLLAEARRLREKGDYRKAIVCLFSYQLIQLDKHQAIRLTRGKTNRQYMNELRPRAKLCQLFQETMIAFEEVFFGDHNLDHGRFEACWRRLDEFHGLIESVPTQGV